MSAGRGIPRLTDDEVLALRARKARGEHIDVKAEADRFMCGPEAIRRLLRGETFRHLLTPSAPARPEPGAVLDDSEMEAVFDRFQREVRGTGDPELPDFLGGSK